jgi:hypothetical protein
MSGDQISDQQMKCEVGQGRITNCGGLKRDLSFVMMINISTVRD